MAQTRQKRTRLRTRWKRSKLGENCLTEEILAVMELMMGLKMTELSTDLRIMTEL